MNSFLKVLRDVAIFAIAYIVVAIALSLIIKPTDDFNFMLFTLLCGLIVLVLSGLYEKMVYGRCGAIECKRGGFDARAILWGVIFMVAVSVVLSPLEALLPTEHQTLPEGGWTMLAAVIIGPILEELIFRGRLISILGYTCRPGLAVVISAFVFAVAHGNLFVGISAFISGVIFGYFYLLKRSILTPIILHICNNAVAYSLIVLSYQDKSVHELIGESKAYYIIYIASWIVVAVGMMHLIRTMYRADSEATPCVGAEAAQSNIKIEDDVNSEL